MTLQAKIIAALIMAVLLTALSVIGTQQVLTWKRDAEVGQARGRTLESTSGVISDIGHRQEARVKVDIGVADARQAFKQAIEEAKTHEPDTTARASRAVPSSVRRAYRERRIARERLGRDDAWSEAGAPKKDAPER